MQQPPARSQARSEQPPSMEEPPQRGRWAWELPGTAITPTTASSASPVPGAAAAGPVHPSLHPSPRVFISFKWLSKTSVIYSS